MIGRQLAVLSLNTVLIWWVTRAQPKIWRKIQTNWRWYITSITCFLDVWLHIELNREFFVSWQLATHNSCAANEFYPTFWPSSPSAPLSLNSHHHLIIENTPPSKIQPSLNQGDQRFRLVSQLCCQASFNWNLDLCGPKSKRPLRSLDIVNIYFPTLRFLLGKITSAERNRLFQDLFCWLVEELSAGCEGDDASSPVQVPGITSWTFLTMLPLLKKFISP